MSTFTVTVLPVKIEAHTNADSLEIARIGDFKSIVRKGEYHDGDLVAYIPEGLAWWSEFHEQEGYPRVRRASGILRNSWS